MRPGTNDNNILASSSTSIAYSNCFLRHADYVFNWAHRI
jgi:hypothetical protein